MPVEVRRGYRTNGIQVAVVSAVGCENWTWVLCKKDKSSWLLIFSLAPHFTFTGSCVAQPHLWAAAQRRVSLNSRSSFLCLPSDENCHSRFLQSWGLKLVHQRWWFLCLALAVLEFTWLTRPPLNSACLCFPCTKIKGAHHQPIYGYSLHARVRMFFFCCGILSYVY